MYLDEVSTMIIKKYEITQCPVCNSKELELIGKKDTSGFPCNIEKNNPVL